MKLKEIFANLSMSHAKRLTPNKRQNPEYHVVLAIRRLRGVKNCQAENTRLNIDLKKKMSSISDLLEKAVADLGEGPGPYFG